MSPHPGADGLVQGELPLNIDRFPWRTVLLPPMTAGSWAGIGEDCQENIEKFMTLNKTRQQLRSESMQLSSQSTTTKKVPIALGGYTSLRTRRHSAVQCWTRVVRMPWYLQYSGQYLGTSGWTPVRVRWVCLVARKKNHAENTLNVRLHIKLKIVCCIEKRVTGCTRESPKSL